MAEKTKKLSDVSLFSAIQAEERAAYGYLTGELATDRAQAMDYYLGQPFGNEVEDRSQVVTHDVAETIEWVMPSLMEIFTGGEKLVEFRPVGPEDVAQAEQETDYLNNVLMQQNNAFVTFYSMFQDALLQKNGYAKACWEETDEVEEEHYTGLTEDEYAILAADVQEDAAAEFSEVEVDVSDSITVDPITGLAIESMPISTWTCTVRRTSTRGKLKLYPVPPEELLVSTGVTSPCLQDASFVQHRTEKTISEIRTMGYDVDDDLGTEDDYDLDLAPEALARSVLSEEFLGRDEEASSVDPSLRVVTFKETHIRIDRDGDGVAELLRVCHVGKQILHEEKAEFVNIASITPIIMAHKHIGRSLADLIMDLQLIKSTVMRQILDNMYLANNGRLAISDRVNLQDTLSVRPGGVIRVQGSPGTEILPVQIPIIGPFAFQALEYLDAMRENRSGITKYNQGLDANSLNKTASGISQIMGAAQQRIKLIARVFAETGIKELFLIAHAILCKNGSEHEMVQLKNRWVPVSPRRWRKRTDMTVSVGLGTGNKDQMLAHLMSIMQVQAEHAKGGLPTIQPSNLYNSAKRLVENAGFKQADEFFTDPANVEQPPQQQGPSDAELLIETEKMKAETNIQTARIKADTDRDVAALKAQTEAQIAAAKLASERDMAALNVLRDQERAEMDADNKLHLAAMGQKTQMIAPPELDVLPQIESLAQRIAQGQQEVASATVALAQGQEQLAQSIQALMGAVKVAADSAAQRWDQALQVAASMADEDTKQ